MAVAMKFKNAATFPTFICHAGPDTNSLTIKHN